MKTNRKAILTLFLVLDGLILASCNKTSPKDVYFTVNWLNDNGDVLEVDEKVKKGSVPTYDGGTPTKTGEGYTYTFKGWTPEVGPIEKDMTYTATYTSEINKYTVTWNNYDGSVLEVDNDVPYGTTPSYDGAIPTKPSTEEYNYIFSGWTPEVVKVIDDATYTATFVEKKIGAAVPGIDPVISEDGKTVQYGFYPQKHINDQTLITELEKLTPISLGWIIYQDNYYYKEKATLYNSEASSFDDGTTIVEGNEYWYQCLPIEWNVDYLGKDKITLFSKYLLDASCFYKNYQTRTIEDKTIYANNYQYSNVKTFLSGFASLAFAFDPTYLLSTLIDNSGKTTDDKDNKYICDDLEDKIYLPSYSDLANANGSNLLTCKTTDYVRARGAFVNKRDTAFKNNSSYWTRSPTSQYNYCAWNVNSGGYLSTYAVDGAYHCVRPLINISEVK